VLTAAPPPAAPTGVTAQEGWGGVYINWTAGVGGGTVTGYTIQQSVDNGSTFPTSFNVGNVTTYQDTTATSQPQVIYKIFATGPGGNSSTSSPTTDLAPVYNETSQATVTTAGPLLLDASFAYAVGTANSSSTVSITRISLSNSSVQTQNLAVYTGVGAFVQVLSGIYFGGSVYVLVSDNGVAHNIILKINTSTLALSSSLTLPSASGAGSLVTDGTSCWAISGPNGSVQVTHFDPSTMSNILTGSSLGSGIAVEGATAFGGNIYAGVHNSNTAADTVSRINSTLAIVETVSTSAITFPSTLVNDGAALYVYGFVGSNARVEKYTTGPLAFSASTASLGNAVTTSMVYDSGSTAIYMVQKNGLTAGFMKLSTAPAFVSAIAQSHASGSFTNGALTDGTYAYFSISGGRVARQAISSF
jgi:hypothetical protein